MRCAEARRLPKKAPGQGKLRPEPPWFETSARECSNRMICYVARVFGIRHRRPRSISPGKPPRLPNPNQNRPASQEEETTHAFIESSMHAAISPRKLSNQWPMAWALRSSRLRTRRCPCAIGQRWAAQQKSPPAGSNSPTRGPPPLRSAFTACAHQDRRVAPANGNAVSCSTRHEAQTSAAIDCSGLDQILLTSAATFINQALRVALRESD